MLLASERSERDTIRGVQTRAGAVRIYIYIYMYGGTYAISSTCPGYVMWAELGHSHFLYVPTVSNVVTDGNGTGTKNVLKGTVRLCLSLVITLLSTAQLL